MKKSWKELAYQYDDLDWPFSSAFAWGKVVDETSSPLNLIIYANQLRLSGHFKKAENVIKKVQVEDIPRKHQFYFFNIKGLIYADQGKINKAIKIYKKSIQFNPKETYPYVFLATSLSKKGKLKASENVLLQALNKEGDIDEVNYNLSLIYARQGKLKKAIKTMKNCIRLDPNNSAAKDFLEDLKNLKKTLKTENK